MSKELTVSVDGKVCRCFLQTGFYSHNRYKTLEFHRHSYPEIHIFVNCQTKFIVDNKVYELDDCSAVIVPRDLIHAYAMGEGENSLHCTFLIDAPCDEVRMKHIPRDFLLNFLRLASEITEENMKADHSAVVPYLSFIGTSLVQIGERFPEATTDYVFWIREYMEHNYTKSITLDMLAKHLHVSVKQAERLVMKYTGHTFLEELTLIRMTAAETLQKIDPTVTPVQLAARVGYQSYSGFYKARKKYKEKINASDQ